VLRLRAPDHDITVHDKILGDVTLAADQLEDIVIRKADGWPTYHFAVVIDDTQMAVTLALRGSEHLMNTPKHLGLYEALGWEPVDHGHLPLIFNPGGSKMSKRDKAKTAREAARKERDSREEQGFAWLAASTGLPEADITRFMKKKSDDIPTAEAIAHALEVELPMIEVMDFRRAGYLPEALNNYLALLGWNPGPDPDTGEERELFTLDELVARWDLSRVGKTPARFDPDKLRWMNGEYLRSLSDDALQVRLQQWFDVTDSALARLEPALRDAIIALYRPRASTFGELERGARYFWERPTRYDDKAAQKWLLKGNGLATLAAVRPVLGACDWTEAGIEAAIVGFAADRGIGVGKVAQPIRVALSGAAATPGLWETLVLFDRAEVVCRIDNALATWS
jgi:glutamyl-tRNA synthetase